MDFIITDPDGIELSYLTDYDKLDIEIGGNNNFELQISREISEKLGVQNGGYIFSPGTEWGGRFEYLKSNTKDTTLVWQGITFRKFLHLDFILPKPYEDYRRVSGDANSVLKDLLNDNGAAPSIFTVPTKTTVNVSQTFRRYVNLWTGIYNMLLDYNYKVKITTQQGEVGEPFEIICEAVPIIDYTETLEYSQDNKVYLTITDDKTGTNHLISLGTGDLKNRIVLHTYILKNDKIKTCMDILSGPQIKQWYMDQWELEEKIKADAEEREPDPINLADFAIQGYYSNIPPANSYRGEEEKFDKYDYSSIEGATLRETVDNLAKAAELKIQELRTGRTLDMDVEEFEADIGDIVAGRDRNTGITLSKAVTKQILRNTGGKVSIEVSVEEETTEEEVTENEDN